MAAPDVSTPRVNQDSDVFVIMASMPKGSLCHVHGDVTFPASSTPEGVYLLIVEGNPAPAQLPTAAQIVSQINSGQSGAHGKKITITTANGAVAWKCDNQLTAWCAATTHTKYNTLLAVAASNTFVPGQGYVQLLEGPLVVAFYGKSTTTACQPD